MKNKSLFASFFKNDLAVLIYLALAKLLIHFFANGGYGYFRDELYYMACGDNLALGFVDHPPLIAFIIRFTRMILGDSLFALRFFPALAGALVVFLTGLIVRELGGRRFAQVLAAVAVIVSPIFLGTHNILSMNAFDHLFWTLSAYLIIRILKTKDPKFWILLGVVLGFGLLNKYSMLFFIFGFVVGLLLTPNRKYFLSKWIWVSGTVAFLIFLPNLIWQVVHRWPTLEFMRNASLYKIMALSPLEFLAGQILEMHPFTFPILILGLAYFLFSKSGKPYQLFGWMYIVLFLLFVLTRSKTYYFAPIYPVMFAAGAVGIGKFIQSGKRWAWLKPVSLSFLIIGGLLTAPMVLPVLPVDSYIEYSTSLGISHPPTERHEMGLLPQFYADMFGWENMAATVAEVYEQLSPEEKTQCAIYAQNYGEAGAIDFFGRKHGLPKAISGHNNYWLWGLRGYNKANILIILGGNEADYKRAFNNVKQVATFQHKYVMPYENNLPIYLCRGIKLPLKMLWPYFKHFD